MSESVQVDTSIPGDVVTGVHDRIPGTIDFRGDINLIAVAVSPSPWGNRKRCCGRYIGRSRDCRCGPAPVHVRRQGGGR